MPGPAQTNQALAGWPHDRRGLATLLIVLLAAVLIVPRLLIYGSIQFPAPVGDEILFASVASYHCREGVFATPLFPLDPSGEYRYIWHAIGQPALLSYLNPGCTNAGLFIALSLIVVLTLAIAYFSLARTAGATLSIMFVLAAFALQVKQGFRPETLAIPIVVLGEYCRLKLKHSAWAYCLLLLAWVHPTVFILQMVYSVLTSDKNQWRFTLAAWRVLVPVSVACLGLFVAAYPFPISELLGGLALQGQLFAKRTDGDLATYYLRSDFFPLFGVAFGLVYVLQAVRHKALLLMLPLLWFYAVRVPPAYYNVVPLFVAMLYGLLMRRSESDRAPTRLERKTLVGVSGFVGLLAGVGLAQGNVRDIHSYLRHQSTLDKATVAYQKLRSGGAGVCKVPPFFTLFLPSEFFKPSYQAEARECPGTADERQRVDLHAGAAPSHRAPGCTPWPSQPADSPLGKLFRADSGYSFTACPAEK